MPEDAPKPDPFWVATSPEDALKIREQCRDAEIAREATGREALASAAHAERLKAIEHLQFYDQNTVKMLFLLKAGSILALLAFLGALYSKGDPRS
jgi:hypothetical protein